MTQNPSRGCAEHALPAAITDALALTPALTARESAVFELLGLGYDNRSIARSLAISERTAKRHITAVLAKLGLQSRLQAGLAALVSHQAAPVCRSAELVATARPLS